MSKEGTLNALSKEQAYQLADITKTPPQFGALTPRWLTRFMEFKLFLEISYKKPLMKV